MYFALFCVNITSEAFIPTKLTQLYSTYILKIHLRSHIKSLFKADVTLYDDDFRFYIAKIFIS